MNKYSIPKSPKTTAPSSEENSYKCKAVISALSVLDSDENRKVFPPENREWLYVIAHDYA